MAPLLGAAVLGLASLVACGADDDSADPGPIDECDWAMWGHGPDRTFSYPCDTALAPGTVGDLEEAWFFNAEDAVTATPAVVDGTVYVGDWSGNFYALDLETGERRWTFRARVHPRVYAGQIVSSAAVADVDGERTSTSARATRSMPSPPTTASLAGSTDSRRKATTTIPGRSSRRRSWPTGS
jgi:outer membrane protein assembly factor BamB